MSLTNQVVSEGSFTSFPATSYAEEPQDFPVKFETVIFLGGHDWKRLHAPVVCRDFLGDVYSSWNFQNDYSIYGFQIKSDDIVKEGPSGFRVTFPTAENKHHFTTNFYRVLVLFRIPISGMAIYSYLNDDERSVVVTIPRRSCPAFVSFLSFLVKISGYDLSSTVFANLFDLNDVQGFIKWFKQTYPRKDASYFDWVNADLFLYMYPIFKIGTNKNSFWYLEKQKDNINYMHNQSGFFSQFKSDSYGLEHKEFRNFIGTFLRQTGESVPFQYIPFSKEDFETVLGQLNMMFSYYNSKRAQVYVEGAQIKVRPLGSKGNIDFLETLEDLNLSIG
jgi:hypothetical protein